MAMTSAISVTHAQTELFLSASHSDTGTPALDLPPAIARMSQPSSSEIDCKPPNCACKAVCRLFSRVLTVMSGSNIEEPALLINRAADEIAAGNRNTDRHHR